MKQISCLFLVSQMALGQAIRANPNVILIISDDAGYADFGFMNGLSGKTSEVPTPHLDALAKRGVVFSRAYVAANCQPTRAAIVTGAYQQRIGNENVGNNNFRASEIFEGIPDDTETIWDRMKSRGYQTGAVGKWHLGQIEDTPERRGNRPQNQGVDEFYGIWHGSRDFMVGRYNNPKNNLQVAALREAIVHPDGRITDEIVENDHRGEYITNTFGEYGVQFIKKHAAAGKPFFLYQSFTAPHKPWTDESPDFNDSRITGLSEKRRQVASMMITMDKEIGRMMEALEDPDGDSRNDDSISKNTLVIFINDNGGVSGGGTDNGQLDGVKGSPKEGGIRVPMIMAGAGISIEKRGAVYRKPVHGIDLLPTAFGLAGGAFEKGEKIDGVNLLPYVNGILEEDPHDVLVHRWRGTFSVIKGDWKLVNTHNVGGRPDRYRLYNVAEDVGEKNNLIKDPAQADRISRMKRDLTRHEAVFDKSRYPILARTLENEPLNIVDHFVFRPGIHSDWSGSNAWYEGGTTKEETLYSSDGFPGAIIEFPASHESYVAKNDLRRQTGLDFMLNRILLTGSASGDEQRKAEIKGNDLLFTRNLDEEAPRIVIDAIGQKAGSFSYDLVPDLILFDDLILEGDGNVAVKISGKVRDYDTPRGLIKNGGSHVTLTAKNSFSGNIDLKEGGLSFWQTNDENEMSEVHLAGQGATLKLTFKGSDTVGALFIDGKQQPSGIYKAAGAPGPGKVLPQLAGTGSLTVTHGPK